MAVATTLPIRRKTLAHALKTAVSFDKHPLGKLGFCLISDDAAQQQLFRENVAGVVKIRTR
jgi:hypothetical protein